MDNSTLICSHCGNLLPLAQLEMSTSTSCLHCGASTLAAVFPASRRHPAPLPISRPAGPDDAACFYHAAIRATVPCDHCGRFLCALCDLPAAGRHLCPPCLETAQLNVADPYFVARRIRYDNLALLLAVSPVLFFPLYPLSLFTAPACLFIVLRFWKRDISLLFRSRPRFTAALLLATAQLAGWAALLYLGFYRLFT